MSIKMISSIIISTTILFLWGAISQLLPWGVSVTQNISILTKSSSIQSFPENAILLPENNLVNVEFEKIFINKISTLTTENTFSWIITKPISYFNLKNYLFKELLTQFFVAVLLSAMVYNTKDLSKRRRILILLISSILAIFPIYFQLMNWWGVPIIFALGSGLNLIIGWILSYIAISKILV